MALSLLQRYNYLKNRTIVICLCKKPANYLDHNIFCQIPKVPRCFSINQSLKRVVVVSGSRGEAMNTQSSNVPLTVSITILIVEKV